jgi:hypothetical protein
MQPRFNRIEAGLPRTKASIQSHHSSPTFNLQKLKHYYKLFQLKVNLYKHCFQTTSYTACPGSQRKSINTRLHVAKVDTTLSPKLGVTQEGHCQPGTDPTPRTSQTEQRLAMPNYLGGSQMLYLKNRVARLSILIFSKT